MSKKKKIAKPNPLWGVLFVVILLNVFSKAVILPFRFSAEFLIDLFINTVIMVLLAKKSKVGLGLLDVALIVSALASLKNGAVFVLMVQIVIFVTTLPLWSEK